MTSVKNKKMDYISDTRFKTSVLTFGRITVMLPLGSLIFCFFGAVLFKYNEVNITVCQVQNYIPSISAITGVAPLRYVWRICIALHSTPRFVIGFLLYNTQLSLIDRIAQKSRGKFMFLINLSFWIYTIENACLVGVSFIGNFENYPVHEKIFVVFMVTSLVYELLTLILFKWTHPNPMEEHEALSFKLKSICYGLNMSFTVGLVYFFLRHRFYCEPLAFTWFAAFEYGIAITNILYHYTATLELKGYNWYFGLPSRPTENNHHSKVQ